MDKLLGGPLLPTITKLALACVAVGIILAIFGVDPYSIWENFLDTALQIWDMGFDLVDWALKYLLLGAIIVIPIWLISRFWSVIFDRTKSTKGSGNSESS